MIKDEKKFPTSWFTARLTERNFLSLPVFRIHAFI